MDIYDRIRQLRKTLGYTQDEFADKLEIAKPTISNWERGEQNLTPSRIFQICSTFHVRRTWLESGEGDMFGPVKPRLTRADTFVDVGIQLFKSLPREEQEIVLALAKKIVETSSVRTNGRFGRGVSRPRRGQRKPDAED